MRRPERFWSMVDVLDDGDRCWNWRGATNGAGGYGQLDWHGHHVTAHRVAYLLSFGEIEVVAPALDSASNLFVLHKCDNRLCCNPEHLFLGSLTDNMHDMHKKKRHPQLHGHLHPNSKLSPDAVQDIRRRYKTNQSTQTELANEYGLSQTAIGFIVRGKSYRNVA